MNNLLTEEITRIKQMMLHNTPDVKPIITREKQYNETQVKPTSLREFVKTGEKIIKEDVEPEINRGMRVQRILDGKTGHISTVARNVVWSPDPDKIYHVQITFDDGTTRTENFDLFKHRYNY